MLGAIIGDIVGSRFEWENCKSKNFELFTGENFFSDDTVMTCALAECLVNGDFGSDAVVKSMRKWYRKYPSAGYGAMFEMWCEQEHIVPYGSYGNGSAMRTSAVPYFSKTLEECNELAKRYASVTHDHPEGIKGAVAISSAIWLALHNHTKDEIREHIENNFYELDFDYADLIKNYKFDASCQGSVPQALWCFFQGKDFEDCIRTAVSIGGDCDTICAMVGSIAEAYYGISETIKKEAFNYLTNDIIEVVNKFYKKTVQ